MRLKDSRFTRLFVSLLALVVLAFPLTPITEAASLSPDEVLARSPIVRTLTFEVLPSNEAAEITLDLKLGELFGLVGFGGLRRAVFSPALDTVELSPVSGAFDSVKKNVQQPFASAARTTTATSSTFTLPGHTTIIGYLDVTAASGTSPTLNVKLQDSPDGGTTFFDLLTFTQATGVTSQVLTNARGLGDKIRVVATIGGTTPSFTFSFTFISY